MDMDYDNIMPHDGGTVEPVLDGGAYVSYELEFLAGRQWLAIVADGLAEEWGGRWLARCRDLARAVAGRAVLREADGRTEVDTGLTPCEIADVLFVCGLGCAHIFQEDAIVDTYGLDGIRRCMDVRAAGERALERNTVLAVCRGHLGEFEVGQDALRDEWVATYEAEGATGEDFDRLFADLRREQKVVLNLDYMYAVADDEEVPGYPDGVTLPATAGDHGGASGHDDAAPDMNEAEEFVRTSVPRTAGGGHVTTDDVLERIKSFGRGEFPDENGVGGVG